MGREYFSRPYLNTFLVGLTHFGGNGELGDVVIDTDTTLEPKIYQYRNLTIEEGVTVTVNGSGDSGGLFLFVKEKFVLKGTIDLRGKGAAGGSGAPRHGAGYTGGGASGTDGTQGGYKATEAPPAEVPWCVAGAGAGGGAGGGAGSYPGGDGGDGGGAGGQGGSGSTGVAGANTTPGGNGSPTSDTKIAVQRLTAQDDILLSYGAGGGGGGAGAVGDTGTGTGSGYGGDGGAGGGWFYVECDRLQFTSTGTIDVRGEDGQPGGDADITDTDFGAGGGGGGAGGGGGLAWIRVRRVIEDSGTKLAAGGTGAAGGSGAAGGIGNAYNGTAGGDGADGLILIEELEA